VPDAVQHEPSRPVRSELQFPLKLLGSEALLATGNQVERHHPFDQRDMARFHDRSHGDGELLPARPVVALDRTGPMGFPFQSRAVVRIAVHATRPVRPANFLKVLAGLVVVEPGKV